MVYLNVTIRAQVEDSWADIGGIDSGSGGDGAEESNGEKGGTTVTEHQYKNKDFKGKKKKVQLQCSQH